MGRRLFEVPTLRHDTAVYLAGLIDGEGCFSIVRAFKNKASTGFSYTARLRLVLTDEKTIAWVASEWVRPYHFHYHQTNTRNQKSTYRVEIGDIEGLISLLPQIIPYMITKRAAAEAVFDFCSSRRGNWRKAPKERWYTTEEVQLYESVRLLNLRGLAAA